MTFNRRDLVTLVIALTAAFALGAWLRWSRLDGVDVSDRSTLAEVLQDRAYPLTSPANHDVTMVIFTDYRCPACRASDPAMRSALTADGKVRVIYRDWPIFGEASRQAARVALASAQQGIYPALHHRLMRARQLEDEAPLLAEVRAAGGDVERLKRDLAAKGREVDERLALTAQQAMTLGMRGTPSFVIGKKRYEGAMSERQFRKAFALARQR